MWSRALLHRRKVLGLGLAAGMMAPANTLLLAGDAASKSSKITQYRTLGSTGLEISDISFGSSRSSDPDLVRYALDRGITFFDTAESYRFGAAESALGEGLRGIRKDVVLASKTKAAANARSQEIMDALEGSLRRLETDYLDIYYNHAVNDLERVRNDEWYEFCFKAKQQGKLRFTGVSGHGKRLVQCLEYVIDHDLVDVVLVAYNFGQDPNFLNRLKQSLHFSYVQSGLPPVLKKARDKGIGVVAMKTLMGARRSDMEPFEQDGDTFPQSAFRWVLSSPEVDGLVVSMTSREEIDEYIGASGPPGISESQVGLLDIYMERNGSTFCQPGCNQCMGACPYGVDLAEIFRTRMYLLDYQDPVLARQEYEELTDNAKMCVGCTGTPCKNACPLPIPLHDWLKSTARALG